MDTTRLIFLMDPQCGWCFGFADTISKFYETVAQNSSVTMSVVPGGLFVPGRKITGEFIDGKLPIAQKISKRFGVQFSPAYFSDVLGGDLWLDSTPPCRGLCAANLMDASKSLPFSVALIKAAFVHGRNISKPEVVIEVAGEQGFDVTAFREVFESDEASQALSDSLEFSRSVGTGFPSILVQDGDRLVYAGGSELTIEDLTAILGRLEVA